MRRLWIAQIEFYFNDGIRTPQSHLRRTGLVLSLLAYDVCKHFSFRWTWTYNYVLYTLYVIIKVMRHNYAELLWWACCLRSNSCAVTHCKRWNKNLSLLKALASVHKANYWPSFLNKDGICMPNFQFKFKCPKSQFVLLKGHNFKRIHPSWSAILQGQVGPVKAKEPLHCPTLLRHVLELAKNYFWSASVKRVLKGWRERHPPPTAISTQ